MSPILQRCRNVGSRKLPPQKCEESQEWEAQSIVVDGHVVGCELETRVVDLQFRDLGLRVWCSEFSVCIDEHQVASHRQVMEKSPEIPGPVKLKIVIGVHK